MAVAVRRGAATVRRGALARFRLVRDGFEVESGAASSRAPALGAVCRNGVGCGSTFFLLKILKCRHVFPVDRISLAEV